MEQVVTPKRVVVVDGDPFAAQGIRFYFQQRPTQFEVCTYFSRTAAAEAQIDQHRPRIVIVDPELDGGGGFQLIRKWARQLAGPSFVARVARADPGLLMSALREGATAVVMRSEPPEALELAVSNSVLGYPHLSAGVSEVITHSPITPREEVSHPEPMLHLLPPREQQVYQMLGAGTSVSVIAGKLGRSPKTVQAQCQSIQRRLGLKDLAMLKRHAIRAAVYSLQISGEGVLPPVL